LLGYNFPLAPTAVGCVAYVSYCVLFGAVLCWLRERSGSVLPAALAHGLMNTAAGSVAIVTKANTRIDTLWAGVAGVAGQLVLVAAIAVYVAATVRRRSEEAR